MPLDQLLRPYAAKAFIEHEFDTDHLNVFLTFRFQMNQDLKPADGLWICEVDEVEEAVTASAWQDAYTLLLTVADIAVLPERVTLEYDGPDTGLQIRWGKTWEPWGPIVSAEIPPVSTTRTITEGPADLNNLDVSNVNILFMDATTNNITIGTFIGGVNGQVLHIAKVDDSANNVTLREHSPCS